ncbi:putative endoplasmic reticulum metallopeptidase 1, partial [Arthromyces matolae]
MRIRIKFFEKVFNHAEESLQDASHLFSTQHPIASTVRAVINLEAAGTTGREILFQATSEEMIQAYSHVPRPFGTIFANDIFSSGIILSDTDFRQFEQYMNVTGLDIAIVGNSYLYHMRKDLVENIQAGVAQNMAENVLALLHYLSEE